MSPILMAVDDGLTSGNLNVADILFLLGIIFAGLSGLAYASGFVGSTAAPDTPRPYARFHQWAAALLAFAVGCVAFGLFLL